MTVYVDIDSIREKNTVELAKKLKEQIRFGWQPVGNVIVENQAHYTFYTQLVGKVEIPESQAKLNKKIKDLKEEVESLRKENSLLKKDQDHQITVV